MALTKKRRRHSKALYNEYRNKILVSAKDLHFYGVQAAEDYLDGNLSTIMFDLVMDQIEEDVGRYLLLIREVKKFHKDIDIDQLLNVTLPGKGKTYESV